MQNAIGWSAEAQKSYEAQQAREAAKAARFFAHCEKLDVSYQLESMWK